MTERKLAAILSADVVGYSRLMAEDQEATVRTIGDYREQDDLLVRQHRGRLVDFTGDNFLAEFPTAFDAVQSAVEIQRVLASRNADLSADRKLEFRIGVHLGDIQVEGERIYGDGVNIAARLESLARPGGICISATVHDQVRNKLHVGYHDLGDQTVKNIPDQVHVYQVQLEQPTAAAADQPPARLPLRWVGAALAAAAALIVAGWWILAPSPPLETSEIRSIAVLPLENLSGDPDQDFFADGTTEALIATLARLDGLDVISRTSVMQYKGVRRSLPEIARELGVDAVVEGSIVRVGGRVRVTVQLIDARTDKHLWADSYEREVRDILKLQGELAHAIAREVELELSQDQRARLAEARTVDPAAHEAYLKGRYLLIVDIREAVESFHQAIELDPGYALSYVGLVHAYQGLTVLGQMRPSESLPLQTAAAREAERLDATLGEVHGALAVVLDRSWDWEGAEREFLRALELTPGDAYTRAMWGVNLMFRQRPDQAITELERARALDPLSLPVKSWLGWAYSTAGRHEDAEGELLEVLRLNPQYFVAHAYLGMSYLARGRFERASTAMREMVEQTRRATTPLGLLAAALALEGRADEARELVDEILQRSRAGYIDPNILARVYAALGEQDAAYEWLERAYEEGAPTVKILALANDPISATLRADPRTQELMRRLGLPQN